MCRNLSDIICTIAAVNDRLSMSDALILKKVSKFSEKVERLYDILIVQRFELILSKRFRNSGIAAMQEILDAIAAESEEDWHIRLANSKTQCRDMIYYMQVLRAMGSISESEFTSLENSTKELIKLLELFKNGEKAAFNG